MEMYEKRRQEQLKKLKAEAEGQTQENAPKPFGERVEARLDKLCGKEDNTEIMYEEDDMILMGTTWFPPGTPTKTEDNQQKKTKKNEPYEKKISMN